MSLLRPRAEPPPVPPNPAEVKLAALTGRVDQAVSTLDGILRGLHGQYRVPAEDLRDGLLEVRHHLAGKAREVADGP